MQHTLCPNRKTHWIPPPIRHQAAEGSEELLIWVSSGNTFLPPSANPISLIICLIWRPSAWLIRTFPESHLFAGVLVSAFLQLVEISAAHFPPKALPLRRYNSAITCCGQYVDGLMNLTQITDHLKHCGTFLLTQDQTTEAYLSFGPSTLI